MRQREKQRQRDRAIQARQAETGTETRRPQDRGGQSKRQGTEGRGEWGWESPRPALETWLSRPSIPGAAALLPSSDQLILPRDLKEQGLVLDPAAWRLPALPTPEAPAWLPDST